VAGVEKGADFSLVSGQVAACLPWAVDPASLGPCAVVEVGGLRGEAFGTVERKRPVVAFAAAGAGLFVRVGSLGPFALRAEGLGEIPLTRPSFFLENVGNVRAVPAVVARASLGLEAAIP
jgi:hypothetical protein